MNSFDEKYHYRYIQKQRELSQPCNLKKSNNESFSITQPLRTILHTQNCIEDRKIRVHKITKTHNTRSAKSKRTASVGIEPWVATMPLVAK